MQLPYGKLATSRRGPADLKEMGEAVAKDGLTGYLRVSVFGGSNVQECVIVYQAGKPAMAFASDGTADRKDPDYRQMSEAIRKNNAIVEVCHLQDKQVKLLQDLYREFAVAAPAAVAEAAPVRLVLKEPPRQAATPRPEEKPRMTSAPEIRGRFVRAEETGNLDEYLQRHPGETGHLLLMTESGGRLEEHHVILVKGRIEATYSGNASGPDQLERLKGVSGMAEFYVVSEALLMSIVGRQARMTGAPAADRKAPERLPLERQTSGIGIPARELLEGARPGTAPTRELLESPRPVPSPAKPPAKDDFSRVMGEISYAMEDDVAMVRKVEREFAAHVDELLNKLELSHLRTRKKK